MGVVNRDPVTGRAMRTHGMEATPTYSIWKGMIERCENPNNPAFIRWYGGQGISVCERWRLSFENFLADMGERPAGLTLDRRDGTRGYEPGNCRWATWREQQRNRKSNKRMEFNGELLTYSEIAERIGISAEAFLQRIRLNIRPPRLFDRILCRPDVQRFPHNGEMLTVKELSARIGIKTATIYHRINRGVLPPELYEPASETSWTKAK